MKYNITPEPQRPCLNRSITEKILLQHVRNQAQSSYQKKRITCEQCLMMDRKLLPFNEIKNPSELCPDHRIKKYIQSPFKKQQPTTRLTTHKLETISILSSQDHQRRETINLVDQVLKLFREKEAIITLLHKLFNDIEKAIPFVDYPLRDQILTSVRVLRNDSFFSDTQDVFEHETIRLLKSQERIIQLLRSQQKRNSRLYNSLRLLQQPDQSLVQQIMLLKVEVETLETQLASKNEALERSSYQCNQYDSLFDQTLGIIKQYSQLLPNSSQLNIIIPRQLRLDLETLKNNGAGENDKIIQENLRLKLQVKQMNLTIDQLETANTTSRRSLAQETVDQQMNRLVQELSMIILSKDCSKSLSELALKQLRRLIQSKSQVSVGCQTQLPQTDLMMQLLIQAKQIEMLVN